MKVLLLALFLLAAGCGGDACAEACAKAQRCTAIPGALGVDVASCRARCAQATARTGGAVATCIGASSCEQIQVGQCGSW